MQPLVIKIGGSLMKTGEVATLLPLMAGSRRRIVVVPGGGAYADDVRAKQTTECFSDAEAHRRAVLAMHATGEDFVRAEPRLRLASTEAAFEAAWNAGCHPVWLAWPMVSGDPTLAQDWTTTSDSLAAWLAGRLDADAVVLVKSCLVAEEASLEELAAAGVVDRAFCGQAAAAGVPVHVLGPQNRGRLTALLERP